MRHTLSVVVEDQSGVAQDGHKNVVEVVGNTAGQDPEALELLGLLNSGLQAPAFLLGFGALDDLVQGAGDGVDQIALFRQERPFATLGPLLEIMDFHRAPNLAMGDDVSPLAPRALLKGG